MSNNIQHTLGYRNIFFPCTK